jgi:hypothetical protein
MPSARSKLPEDFEPDTVCPAPGGCESCPEPAYCRQLRIDTGVTTQARKVRHPMSLPDNTNIQAVGDAPIIVALTIRESQGLRMALAFGVPDPEPDEIKAARRKLLAAERSHGHAV